MITFRRKNFSEYDAMRSLYVELMRNFDRSRIGVIDSSALIPILRGNNIVIERFVISTSLFGKDKYRMYLKIGSRAKLPDQVRLPQRTQVKKLGNFQLNINRGIFDPKSNGNSGNNSNNGGNKSKNFSVLKQTRTFASKSNNKPLPIFSTQFSPYVDLSYEVSELLGDAILYDKKSRSLVLEFSTIQDAIRALNILPFGIGYKIYLLDS